MTSDTSIKTMKADRTDEENGDVEERIDNNQFSHGRREDRDDSQWARRNTKTDINSM